MTTGSLGGVDAGNDPSSCTKALARPPSAPVTTISLLGRLPGLALEHNGSMPRRIIGLAGAGPVSLIRPLIVPVPPPCAAAVLACPAWEIQRTAAIAAMHTPALRRLMPMS